MKNALKNPKARIALLAVLVVGGAYFLMRGRSAAAADPTAGLPVNPTTTTTGDTLGSGLLGGGGGGVTVPASGSADLGDNGLQQNIDAAKGQLQQFSDYIGSTLAGGSYAIPDPVATDTGASNLTGGRTISGDGSAAAPGNAAVAAAGKSFFARFRGSGLAAPTGKGSKKKKKRNTGNKAQLGRASAAVTRSGAIVITRPQAQRSIVALFSGSSGGGYSAPSYAAPATARAASARLPGGGGGYITPSSVRRANLAASGPAPQIIIPRRIVGAV